MPSGIPLQRCDCFKIFAKDRKPYNSRDGVVTEVRLLPQRTMQPMINVGVNQVGRNLAEITYSCSWCNALLWTKQVTFDPQTSLSLG